MIVRGAKRHGRTKVLAAAGVVVLLVAFACEAPAPTALKTEATDGAAAAQAQTSTPTVGAVVDSAVSMNPLVIVDGVRQHGKPKEILARLDQGSIESIEVIKGAAARRVFGDDGANGVIQITTKSAASSTRAEEERAKVKAMHDSAAARGAAGTGGALLKMRDPTDADWTLRGGRMLDFPDSTIMTGITSISRAPSHAAPGTGDNWVTNGSLPTPGNTTIVTGITSISHVPGVTPQGTVTVDGKPFNGDLSTFDVSTIDHIEIVKGATAGAGVIRIVTKKAARGGRED